jgi:hypothetical protein
VAKGRSGVERIGIEENVAKFVSHLEYDYFLIKE